jgi:hypothetical protein
VLVMKKLFNLEQCVSLSVKIYVDFRGEQFLLLKGGKVYRKCCG